MASVPDEQQDEVSIAVTGGALGGWKEIEIRAGIEAFPNDFRISASDLISGGGAADVKVAAGDACTVMIGGDPVITGYVDRDIHDYGPNNHSLSLTGRGKTQDLADCSAEWPSGQMIGGDALQITEKLCQPYKIRARLGPGAKAGAPIVATLLNYGETGAEIIQRVARNAGLIPFENASGDIVLAVAGATRAASGIAYGENVESLSVSNGVDQRYSDIVGTLMAQDTLIELGEGGFFFVTKKDPNIKRHRLMYLVVDQGIGGQEFTKTRAQWEVNRRFGRAYTVRAVVDSWRDSAGTLWTPNTLVPVNVPNLAIPDKELLLAEVTFRRNDSSGTTAELLLMPALGFAPEPIQLIQAQISELK